MELINLIEKYIPHPTFSGSVVELQKKRNPLANVKNCALHPSRERPSVCSRMRSSTKSNLQARMQDVVGGELLLFGVGSPILDVKATVDCAFLESYEYSFILTQH